MVFTSHITLRTASRTEVINISDLVRSVLLESKISDGIASVFSGHTSAGLYLGIFDERIPEDFVNFTDALVPNKPDYKHNIYGGKNADSHLKSILIGNSLTVPITDAKLDLGQWQGIFFAEFSGPKERKITVKVIGERGE